MVDIPLLAVVIVFAASLIIASPEKARREALLALKEDDELESAQPTAPS